MAETIPIVEDAIREHGLGETENPPKPGIHPRKAFIHAMPAYIPSQEAAGMKWISGYPGNQAKGLPYITGLMILNDPETGIPTAFMIPSRGSLAGWIENGRKETAVSKVPRSTKSFFS